ncbi:hypothetical protein L3X38_042072 [Prunus dulcis]|uniref:Uncharacterized protein n=1 Tax=Prunus dulcis TaxID=3755 RepID=A0AAD4UV75_PRUDU|nr:hypothetical protein L3X38_042072 [Prunus dulcis]
MTSTKADTPFSLLKEDTLSSDLHKVSHRNFVQTSHFYLPINRKQYLSKKGNFSFTFTVTLPNLPPLADLSIGEPSAGITPMSKA